MTIASVLFSEMTPDTAWEGEFNTWYDEEHIPLRMAVPGFLGAQRYKAVDDTGYLAIYDMENPAVLSSEAYHAVKGHPSDTTARMLRDVSGFTRYTGELTSWQMQPGLSDEELLGSNIAYSVLFSVPPDRAAEFDDWYVRDHVQLLLEEPAWLGCRRYRIVDGQPSHFTHLAIHHLSSPTALDSPARQKARASDWREKLAREPWFKGTYRVFARQGARFHAASAAARI